MDSLATSQWSASPSIICRRKSRAASMAAQPVANVTRLPPVTPVKAMLSVSGTMGSTSSTGIPSVSAACMATDVRVPPMSTEPSRSVTVPSAFS